MEPGERAREREGRRKVNEEMAGRNLAEKQAQNISIHLTSVAIAPEKITKFYQSSLRGLREIGKKKKASIKLNSHER